MKNVREFQLRLAALGLRGLGLGLGACLIGGLRSQSYLVLMLLLAGAISAFVSARRLDRARVSQIT